LRGKATGAVYYVNGVDRTTNTGNTGNFGVLNIGAIGSTTEVAACDVAEIIIYDNDIGDVNYNDVGFYLQDKYGISAGYTDSGGGGPTQKNAIFGELFRAPFAKPFGG
jgi:hypothetical protein